MIRTVAGDIEPAALGFTYSHEHLISTPPLWMAEQDPDLVILDEERAVAEVEIARSLGVQAIFEASPWDYGRDPRALKRIAERTGVSIIGCAGFNKGQWFDAPLADWPLDRIEEQIVRDVEVGMDGTDVKGGVIKFGTGYNHISPVEERVIRAAARAHRRTGAPLHGHTETGTMAPEQIAILREEGVDLARVGFVHLTRNPDPWLHAQIAETGVYLVYDGFSKIKYGPESVRVDLIARIVEAGHERQLLVGGDLARKSDLAAYTGGPGLGYIAGPFLARLRAELGARLPANRVEEIVRRMFVDNPADYFAMTAPY